MSDELERRLASLESDDWERVELPPLDLARAVADSGRPVASRGWVQRRGPAAGRRRALVLRPVAAVACAVVLLGLGLGAGVLITEGGEPADRTPAPAVAGPVQTLASVRLDRVDPGPLGAEGVARLVRADRGPTLVVDARGLPPTGADEFYELWALRTRDELVSLGTFRVGADGRARVEAFLPVDRQSFPIVDVSLERADGDPTHSAVSVLRSAPA